MNRIDISKFSVAYISGSSPAEQHALDELTSYFHKGTGKNLKQEHVPEEALPHCSILMASRTAHRVTGPAAAGRRPSFKTDDEFAIRNMGRHGVLLIGASPRALHYAVYAFLNKLGFHWPSCGRHWEIAPARKVRSIEDPTTCESPRFAHRGIDPVDRIAEYTPKAVADHMDWIVRNRMNRFICMLRNDPGHMMQNLVPVIAHEASLRGIGVTVPIHAMDVIPRCLFKEHPEYFSYRPSMFGGSEPRLPVTKAGGGRREAKQLCVSNKAMLKRFGKNLRRLVDRFPPTITDFCINANDGAGFCSCSYCRKLRPSDQAQVLWNTARESLATYRPEIRLHRLSYRSWQEPPSVIHADPDDMASVLCDTIVRSNERPLDEPAGADDHWFPGEPHLGSAHEAVLHRMKQWVRRGFTLVAWENVMRMYRRGTGGGMARIFEKDFELHDRIGVSGSIFEAWIQYWPGFAASFYAASRMLWNRGLSANSCIDEFSRLSFGKARKPVAEYLKGLESVTQRNLEEYKVFDRLTDRDVERFTGLFGEARSMIADTNGRARLRDLEDNFEYMRLWRDEKLEYKAAQHALKQGRYDEAGPTAADDSEEPTSRGTRRNNRATDRLLRLASVESVP